LINLPEAVIEVLLKEGWTGLPDYFYEYLYLLLEKEQKEKYPSFNRPTEITQKHVDAYAYTILVLINAGYKLQEPGQGIRVPLYQLKGWEWEDLNEFQISPELTGLTIRTTAQCMWRDILEMPFYVRFHWKDRFKHTWLLGGTGAGKTVLLQQLISFDIKTKASVVVIDSSGDLIDKLKNSKLIPPNRLVLIDPVDSITHPLALNMFDVDLDLEDPVMYERQVNNVVDQLSFIFSSILDSDLTGKQNIVLEFCCGLMVRTKEATVRTFLQLLRKKTWSEIAEYHDIIKTMPESVQEFFETAYPESTRARNEYNATKGEVHRRLLSLLSNTTISRLFTSPVNRLDIGKEMNKGKIILINTDISLLGERGTAFLGRFFISQISQATLSRMNVPEKKRRPAFVYIDECGDYLQTEDSKVKILLDKARKYRVGMTLSHQRRSQLQPGVYNAIKSNTVIQIVGSPEPGEVNTLLRDLRVDNIPSNPGRFAVYVKGSQRGMHIRSRMGIIEDGPQRSESEFENVIRENRAKYCVGGEKPSETHFEAKKEVKIDESSSTPKDPLAPYT
jgi:hypothetical protein